MNKFFVLIFCIVFLLVGCKTIRVNNKQFNISKENLILGSVGEVDISLFNINFKYYSVPKFQDPIKVKVNSVAFNKSTYKSYKLAWELQKREDIQVEYIDSLPNPPVFLTLTILDKIGLIAELNDDENDVVTDYLKKKAEAQIITEVSIVFSESEIKAILAADEVFLESAGIKNYSLKLYTMKNQVASIPINKGGVFGFKTSGICWEENKRKQLIIVDIVEGQKSCPKKTFKSSQRAIKKTNYNAF